MVNEAKGGVTFQRFSSQIRIISLRKKLKEASWGNGMALRPLLNPCKTSWNRIRKTQIRIFGSLSRRRGKNKTNLLLFTSKELRPEVSSAPSNKKECQKRPTTFMLPNLERGESTRIWLGALQSLKSPGNVSRNHQSVPPLHKAEIKRIPSILRLQYDVLTGETSTSAQHYWFYGSAVSGARPQTRDLSDISPSQLRPQTTKSLPHFCKYVTCAQRDVVTSLSSHTVKKKSSFKGISINKLFVLRREAVNVRHQRAQETGEFEAVWDIFHHFKSLVMLGQKWVTALKTRPEAFQENHWRKKSFSSLVGQIQKRTWIRRWKDVQAAT